MMTSSLPSLTRDLVDRMKSLVDSGLHDDQGKLVSVKDQLRDLLVQHNLAEYRREWEHTLPTDTVREFRKMARTR